MMLRRMFMLAGLSSVVMLGGCATLFNDSKQRVTIKSTPDGAEVVIDGRTIVTPTTIELKGKSEYYISANKEGFRETPGKIGSEVRMGSAIVGNVFSWGLLGMGVDFIATGTAYKMDPEVNIVLLPAKK